MAVITISREVGSGGDEIAHQVCELLGYRYFDKTLMAEVAQEQGLFQESLAGFSEDSYRLRGFIDALLRRSTPVARAMVWTTTPQGGETRVTEVLDEETAAALLASAIRGLRTRGQVVVVGRGGQAILRDEPGVLHVRVVAHQEDRVQRLMQTEGLKREAALSLIGERDRATAQYLRRFHNVDWADPTLYHLTINSSLLGNEMAAVLIAEAAKRLEVRSRAK